MYQNIATVGIPKTCGMRVAYCINPGVNAALDLGLGSNLIM